MRHLPEDAQWFDPIGACIGCGKPATGFIRGFRNDNCGAACASCAGRAIRAAHRLGEMAPDWVIREKRPPGAVNPTP